MQLLSKLKYSVAIGAIALGLGFAFPVNASETVDVNITSVGAITSGHVADIDFGQWFLDWTASTIVLTMNAGTGVVTPTLNGNTATSLSTPTNGELTVTLPGASNTTIHMTHTAPTAFTQNTVYSITGITYTDTTHNNADFTAAATSKPILIVADNVAESIKFGAEITVSAAPVPGADSSSFDVTFAY